MRHVRLKFFFPIGVYFVRAWRVSWLQKRADTCCLYFILTRHISIEQELFEQRQFLTCFLPLLTQPCSLFLWALYFFSLLFAAAVVSSEHAPHIFIARNCSLAFLCRYISLFSVIVITFLCKFRRGVYFLLRVCHHHFFFIILQKRAHWVVCAHRNNKLFG
jgi:hypothetical protein